MPHRVQSPTRKSSQYRGWNKCASRFFSTYDERWSHQTLCRSGRGKSGATMYSKEAYMTSDYANWIGQTVVLQLSVEDLRAPVRGFIVDESEDTVCFCVGKDCEVDIPKSMILAVEEVDRASVIN